MAYFKEEIKLYPKSPLVNDALDLEANALIGLHRYGDALRDLPEVPENQSAGRSGLRRRSRALPRFTSKPESCRTP